MVFTSDESSTLRFDAIDSDMGVVIDNADRIVAICCSEVADRCSTCGATKASCYFADGLDEGIKARLGEIILGRISFLGLIVDCLVGECGDVGLTVICTED